MSRSSFTASERRGVIVIAIISLLLVGAGVLVALLKGAKNEGNDYPIVVEHSEMVDSIAVEKNSQEQKKRSGKSKNKRKTESLKNKKTYRKRSPHDESV